MTISPDVFEFTVAEAYEAVRLRIMNGDIVLFSGVEPFSLAIRWATKTPWSHVGLVVRLDAIDRVMLVECVNGAGVHCIALSSLINGSGPHQKPYGGRLLVARHAGFGALANPTSLKEMSEFATDRFGAPYGTGEIIKIILRIIAGRLNRPMPKMLAPDDEYICSEYVAACYAKLPIEVPWDKLGFLAPSDFAAVEEIHTVGVIRTAGTPAPAVS